MDSIKDTKVEVKKEDIDNNGMKRSLKARHIELIALGGTIGVGLFLGSSNAISWSGPSILIAYIIAGLFVFFIMRCLGEMLYSEPISGSFVKYADKYISPLAGYVSAWCYWFMWILTGMCEITAVGIYVHFWLPNLPQWIPALIGVAIILLANLASVKFYGEFEFWFAMIKILTIIIMIVIGFCLIFFGIGNDGIPIGLSNLTQNGDFFPKGFKGFWFALCIVVVSYQGVELVSITAGEAQNPKKTLRKAIKNIIFRILIFYICSIFVILCIYPWDQIGTAGSPFVLTFSKIGITFAAGLVNFVVLTAALSGCNSGVYSSGRMLYILAKNKQVPAFLGKLSKRGIPQNAIIITTGFLLFSVLLNYLAPNAKLFLYLYSAVGFPAMAPWFVALIAQKRFRAANKESLKTHPFKSILYPYVNYITIAFLIFILVGMWLNEETRISLIIGLIFIAIVIASYFIFDTRKKKYLNKKIKNNLVKEPSS